jgi:multicomponent Na+:H+ antiporter subunit G
MSQALDILVAVLVLSGLAFFAIGTLGLLRLPDFFSRIHAVGKCDTLAALLVLSGLIVRVLQIEGGTVGALNAVKLGFILVFIFILNPTATHAFARAALRSGLQPWTLQDEDRETPDEVPRERRWMETSGKGWRRE